MLTYRYRGCSHVFSNFWDLEYTRKKFEKKLESKENQLSKHEQTIKELEQRLQDPEAQIKKQYNTREQEHIKKHEKALRKQKDITRRIILKNKSLEETKNDLNKRIGKLSSDKYCLIKKSYVSLAILIYWWLFVWYLLDNQY